MIPLGAIRHPHTDSTKYDLDADTLRRLLSYDPDTGIFIWLLNNDRPPNWNGLYPGKEAGYICHDGHRLIAVLVNGKKRRFKASLLAWLYMTGEWPSLEVDHRNVIASDNRWSNLRLATSSQNKANMKLLRRNTSGHKGICWDKARRKWVASIKCGEKKWHKRFDKIEDAISFRNSQAVKLNGEFARAA